MYILQERLCHLGQLATVAVPSVCWRCFSREPHQLCRCQSRLVCWPRCPWRPGRALLRGPCWHRPWSSSRSLCTGSCQCPVPQTKLSPVGGRGRKRDLILAINWSRLEYDLHGGLATYPVDPLHLGCVGDGVGSALVLDGLHLRLDNEG